MSQRWTHFRIVLSYVTSTHKVEQTLSVGKLWLWSLCLCSAGCLGMLESDPGGFPRTISSRASRWQQNLFPEALGVSIDFCSSANVMMLLQLLSLRAARKQPRLVLRPEDTIRSPAHPQLWNSSEVFIKGNGWDIFRGLDYQSYCNSHILMWCLLIRTNVDLLFRYQMEVLCLFIHNSALIYW